jgi:addiction module HigA family antidote
MEAVPQLGVSRMTLHRLLRGEQAVTPEMALRLGKLCGNGPEFWLRMQILRDLWRLERTLAADLACIPTHRAEGRAPLSGPPAQQAPASGSLVLGRYTLFNARRR